MILDTITQHKIFALLLDGKKHQRREFVNLFQVPRTTIYDNLFKLERCVKDYKGRNVINIEIVPNGKRGRPVVNWYIPEEMMKNNKFNIVDKRFKDELEIR